MDHKAIPDQVLLEHEMLTHLSSALRTALGWLYTALIVAFLLLVGVDTQVFHGFVNCNAVGSITGIGNVLPKEVLHLVSLCEKAAKGDATARSRALELDRALGVLSSFDEGPDLVLFYKHMMVLEGAPEYELNFTPTDTLTASQRQYAESQLKLFKAWYRNWSEVRG